MNIRKVGIIGFGNMGSALAAGLAKAGFELAVSDLKSERAKLAETEHGLKVYSKKEELLEFSDLIVIAVKPQDFDAMCEELEGQTAGKLAVSIMAGRKIRDIMQRMSLEALARFMPNLAATVGRAPVGVSFSPHAPADFKEICLSIAQSLGTPVEIPERLMPAITGLSGSGIAYVFAFLHAMALGGVKAGFNFSTALDIAVTTAGGALELIARSKESPQEWISRVISPAGTTIEGMASLEEGAFTSSVMKAVENAARRASDL
jgi:pyrroline-5-carboxylate reductase